MGIRREKRQGSRFRFDRPLIAIFASRVVHLLDVSGRGARIEHEFPLNPGRRRVLEFDLDGERIRVESEVVRCRLEPGTAPKYRTGLRFVEPDQDDLWGLAVALAIDRLCTTER